MKKWYLGICALSLGRPWGSQLAVFTHPKFDSNTVEVVSSCSFRLQAHKHLRAYLDLFICSASS